MLHNGHMALIFSRISSSCILEWKPMTLAISMLTNIFPLHAKSQDYRTSRVSQCATLNVIT